MAQFARALTPDEQQVVYALNHYRLEQRLTFKELTAVIRATVGDRHAMHEATLHRALSGRGVMRASTLYSIQKFLAMVEPKDGSTPQPAADAIV